MKEFAYRFLAWLVPSALLLAASCTKPEEFSMDRSAPSVAPEHREFIPSGRYNRVLLLYAEGHNSLSSYIREDIADLCKGYIPQDAGDALLVLNKLPVRDGRYSDPTSPVLFRLRRNAAGETVRDTLLTFPAQTPAADPETLHAVLSFVADRFPSDHYGMVMSSHGSGWLPAGYYYDPAPYEGYDTSVWLAPMRRRSGMDVDSFPDLPVGFSGPMVRSYGRDQIIEGGKSRVYEMTMRQMLQAFPIHLDFLLFDACLMGCVEVAYELRSVCDLIGFSPAEVIADGMVDYTRLSELFFKGENPDVVSVVREQFEHYDSQPDGDYRSATVSLVDCRKLEPLAGVCRTLFSEYRDRIMALDPNKVQGYFRRGRYYFFDLEDILLQAGITETQQRSLEEALDACIVYKGATPSFIGAFDIKVFSGMSMFLPSIATYYPKKNFSYLNKFYREEVAWNEATGLLP